MPLSGAAEANLIYAIAGREQAAQVLRLKSESGFVKVIDNDPDLVAARDRYFAIRKTLRAISSPKLPTYLLIHSIGSDKSLKSWLIGPDGVVALGQSAGPYQGLESLTVGLGVKRLANVRAGRKKGVPAPSTDSVRSLVQDDNTPASVEMRAASLRETQQILLPGRVAQALGSTSGRLLIVAARDTGTAPFAAMPLANGVAARNWSFVVLPDIATLAAAKPTFDFTDVRLGNALVIGDPDLTGDPKYSWDPLPGARREATLVAGKLGLSPDALLLGKQVTHKAVGAALEHKRGLGLLYIASHAMADPRNPLTRGFIAMGGEHYYAGWIRKERFPGWQAKPPLVVVSACQTALGRVLDGGGFGVTQSWQAAGAGQVVGSLWNVSDRATLYLMNGFMDGLLAGEPAEIAMQKAQLKTMQYRDKNGNLPFANDPKMWASFSVYGKPSRIVSGQSS